MDTISTGGRVGAQIAAVVGGFFWGGSLACVVAVLWSPRMLDSSETFARRDAGGTGIFALLFTAAWAVVPILGAFLIGGIVGAILGRAFLGHSLPGVLALLASGPGVLLCVRLCYIRPRRSR